MAQLLDPTQPFSTECRMSDSVQEEQDCSRELTHLPNIVSAPIPEVEAVLRSADHWHFDAFRLTEASQGYPLSTLGFWLIQQNRVAKEFSEPSSSPLPRVAHVWRFDTIRRAFAVLLYFVYFV